MSRRSDLSRRLRARAGILVAAAVAITGIAVAQPSVARASTPTGGVTLDAWGGLHTFGGASVDTNGAPYWAGWDIARAVAVLPDGSGGWTLDGWGGIHNWGSAPAITGGPSWPGYDIARTLVVLPDEHSGYVLDGLGVIHPFGGAASFQLPSHWNTDIARGLAVTVDSSGAATGGWVMDAWGGLHSFGAAPANPVGAPAYYPGRGVWRQVHLASDGSVYAVGRWGVVTGHALSPDWSGYSDWGSWDAVRDIELLSTTGGSGAQPVSAESHDAFAAASSALGGVTLDLFGGLHPFGGFPLDASGAPYWSGWDIARSVAVLPDGSGGWTLDGWGGVHSWGTAPAITSPATWPGWDIARALAVLPDGHSGYLLDGYGGLHAFGPNAPVFASPSYTDGQDQSRGVSVVTDAAGVATGGWVMDAFGAVHAFGAAPALTDPAQVHPGHQVWQQLHTTLDGRPYAVGQFGVVSAPGIDPVWSGWSDFGGWNAIRDVALGNPDFGGGSQPISGAALNAFVVASSDGLLAKPGCGGQGLVAPAGKYLVISTECQELSAYDNGVLVADTLITTGRPALATEHGHTMIRRKNHPWLMISTWPRGSPYYYNPSWVQYVTWIWPNGTGIHDAYWEPDSALGPGSDLGPYASHGCVHVTLSMAQWIYDWGDVGTPVDVV